MAVNVESRFRATDLWDTPDDGYRYEVVDGELYVNPAPNVAHQYVCGALFLALASHVRAHRLGLVLPAPTTVVLEPQTGVQPDLLFLVVSRLRRHRSFAAEMHRGVRGQTAPRSCTTLMHHAHAPRSFIGRVHWPS